MEREEDERRDQVLPPPLAERRPMPRRKVLLEGKTVYEFGRSAIPCQIRNLSEQGARIVVSMHHYLPRELELVILRDMRVFKAELIWRIGYEAGLAFHSFDRLEITQPGLSPSSKKPAEGSSVLTW